VGGTYAIPAVIATLIYVPMLVEARHAAANERTQRALGGRQPADDAPIYKRMQIAYPAGFAAMILESLIRGGASRTGLFAGLAIFGVSKAVKWWAILTLGRFWTFRVVVVPGATLVARGPYRFLRHPNYVGVAGELVGAALMTAAAVSGPLAIVLFGSLLKRRISVEEKALASSARYPPCSL
jgi:methyltransferase